MLFVVLVIAGTRTTGTLHAGAELKVFRSETLA